MLQVGYHSRNNWSIRSWRVRSDVEAGHMDFVGIVDTVVIVGTEVIVDTEAIVGIAVAVVAGRSIGKKESGWRIPLVEGAQKCWAKMAYLKSGRQIGSVLRRALKAKLDGLHSEPTLASCDPSFRQ